eukprot:9672368-Ditylum_brightwellii.AAC.1
MDKFSKIPQEIQILFPSFTAPTLQQYNQCLQWDMDTNPSSLLNTHLHKTNNRKGSAKSPTQKIQSAITRKN